MNILRQVAIATAQPAQNLVNGSAFEYPQQPSQVSMGVNTSAVGSFITVYAGSRLIAEEFTPVQIAAYPVVPDTMYLNFVILPGERLVVNARNPTGGTITFYLNVDMQPIGR